MSLNGCSSAEDKSPQERVVLSALREAGFMFDTTLVDVIGEEQDMAIVTGPMTGPVVIPAPEQEAPQKRKDNYTPYRQVSLNREGTVWVIQSADRRK